MTYPTAGDLARIFQALDHIDRTHLRPEFLNRAQALLDQNQPYNDIHRQKMELIRDVQEASVGCLNGYELAEVLVYCALAEYHWNNLAICESHLSDAVDRYDGHIHRRSIAQWMLGLIELRNQQPDQAAEHLANAQATFVQLAEFYDLNARAVRVESEVGDAPRAEQAFQWLNIHQPSHLSSTARELVDRLDACVTAVRRGISVGDNTQQAMQLMDYLINHTRDSRVSLEHGEALVECGLAAHRLGNPYRLVAVGHLQMAIQAFPPNSHHQAVAHWMLGCLLLETNRSRDDIVRHWNKAISVFGELALESDYRNRASRADWYRSQMKTMLMVVNQHLGY
jgi:hypothetical protein